MLYNSLSVGRFTHPIDALLETVYMIPGLIIGLTFHEFAHAQMAYSLGDNTPKVQGRVSLNPMKHIEPIGLISLILIGFGWGRPVEINPYNFKKPRRDEFLVSIAGVVTNFILAIVFMGVLALIINFTDLFYVEGSYVYYSNESSKIIFQILQQVVLINLVLMIFNLLPVPPLDGFNIVTALFDLKKHSWWYKVYQFGFPILMILIILGVTNRVLWPILNATYSFIFNIFF